METWPDETHPYLNLSEFEVTDFYFLFFIINTSGFANTQQHSTSRTSQGRFQGLPLERGEIGGFFPLIQHSYPQRNIFFF